MGIKKHERAIARLMKRVAAENEPGHNGTDYRFLALAGLEVATLALAATRDELWPVDEAAVILGDAMAEAAHTGPERWIDRIEGPAKALAQAGRDSEWDDDDEGVWHFQTDLPALVDDLRRASAEVQRADCEGNINADIPAMVLTDLAALTLEQWEGDAPEMDRGRLLATICGALDYMFDWFKDDADVAELARLCALTRALDALTKEDLRPRVGKVPGMQPEAMH